MKNIFYFLISILTIIFGISQYYLDQRDLGLGLFPTKLPTRINIRYDKYDGFILRERNIHIVGAGEKIDSFIVLELLAYCSEEELVFVKVLTEKKDTSIIEIATKHINDDLTNYSINVKPLFRKSSKLNWINLTSNKKLTNNIKKLSFISFVLIILVLLTYIIWNVRVRKKKGGP